MRIFLLIFNPNLIQLDVQELVHTLQGPSNAEVVLELYRHLLPVSVSPISARSLHHPLPSQRCTNEILKTVGGDGGMER